MSNNKVVRFADVPANAVFSPAQGQIGSQYAYRKNSRNGICSRLGAPRDAADAYGIFYPYDRVVVVNTGRPK